MGSISKPPLSRLVLALASELQLKAFVETGTFEGDGAEFAAGVFADVTTIEIRDDYHRAAAGRLAPLGVKQRLGDSRAILPQVVADLTAPALFWLDGHAGAGYFGDKDDCPIILELEAIAASALEHAILVDDARAFIAPPPPPFNAEAWPPLVEVIEAARRRHPYDCVVICDALIFTPRRVRPLITAFCNQVRPKI